MIPTDIPCSEIGSSGSESSTHTRAAAGDLYTVLQRSVLDTHDRDRQPASRLPGTPCLAESTTQENPHDEKATVSIGFPT